MQFFMYWILFNLFVSSLPQVLKRDFKARARFEISLSKGERIDCYIKFDDNFSILSVANRCGIAPTMYIQVFFLT